MVSKCTVVLLAGWLVVIFLLMIPTAVLAQDQPTSIVWNEVGAWSIRVDVPAGIGLEDHTVGYTTDGDEITLSAGGGAGLLLAGEYDVSDHLRFEAGVGIVQSALSMVLENGEGTFTRTVFEGSLLWRVPVKKNATVNLGGGLSLFTSPEMDLDFGNSGIAGAAHNVYSFKSTAGLHMRAEYEYFPNRLLFGRVISAAIGICYESVTYDLESLVSDGTAVPLSSIPTDVYNEMKRVDGSGLCLRMALAVYFRTD